VTGSGFAVDAIGFDFDHTLGVDRRLERSVALQLLGPGHEQAVDLALASYRYGARSFDEAIALTGLDPRSFRTLVVEQAPKFVTPLAGTPELLLGLRRLGIPMAILSNGWSPLQETKAALVGFEGPVLVSDDIGVRKPRLAAFLQLQRALGVAAERILYVGDDPVSDMLGALSARMQAMWLDAEGRSYPQDVAAPTARVVELQGVLAFVQGPLSQTANPPA